MSKKAIVLSITPCKHDRREGGVEGGKELTIELTKELTTNNELTKQLTTHSTVSTKSHVRSDRTCDFRSNCVVRSDRTSDKTAAKVILMENED